MPRDRATDGMEVREAPDVVLALEREAAKLEAGIERYFVIVQLLHSYAFCQRVRIERVHAIGELDLAVVRRDAVRRVPCFASVAGRHAEACGEFLVVLEVAQSASRPEFARRRHPGDAALYAKSACRSTPSTPSWLMLVLTESV
jgi:hypothetical protein